MKQQLFVFIATSESVIGSTSSRRSQLVAGETALTPPRHDTRELNKPNMTHSLLLIAPATCENAK